MKIIDCFWKKTPDRNDFLQRQKYQKNQWNEKNC